MPVITSSSCAAPACTAQPQPIHVGAGAHEQPLALRVAKPAPPADPGAARRHTAKLVRLVGGGVLLADGALCLYGRHAFDSLQHHLATRQRWKDILHTLDMCVWLWCCDAVGDRAISTSPRRSIRRSCRWPRRTALVSRSWGHSDALAPRAWNARRVRSRVASAIPFEDAATTGSGDAATDGAGMVYASRHCLRDRARWQLHRLGLGERRDLHALERIALRILRRARRFR